MLGYTKSPSPHAERKTSARCKRGGGLERSTWYCFDIGGVVLNNFLVDRGYRTGIPNVISVPTFREMTKEVYIDFQT